MELLYKKEHLECFYYDKSEKPLIEEIKILKSEKGKVAVNNNEVVFVMEGELRYAFSGIPKYEVAEGKFLFLHAGGEFYYEVLSNIVLLVFRIVEPIQLCNNFPVEKLYSPAEHADDFILRTRNYLSILEAHPRLLHFIDGVKDCLSDELKCREYFEIKTKELFLLLRIYYTKEALCDFFFHILSEDTAFSEYIRLHWKQFNSIGQMAQSMQLSHKQFSKRFISILGETPQRWMTKAKAQNIYNEILLTDKLFKQIAIENGLGSDTHFTWFCKKNFGKSPSDIRKLRG